MCIRRIKVGHKAYIGVYKVFTQGGIYNNVFDFVDEDIPLVLRNNVFVYLTEFMKTAPAGNSRPHSLT